MENLGRSTWFANLEVRKLSFLGAVIAVTIVTESLLSLVWIWLRTKGVLSGTMGVLSGTMGVVSRREAWMILGHEPTAG